METDPGPISFHDIAQNRNGLYVNPLEWTSHHLDMVGCRFESIPIFTQGSQNDHGNDDGDDPETNPSSSRGDAECLATSWHQDEGWEFLMNIFGSREEPRFKCLDKKSSFYFHGRARHKLIHDVFLREIETEPVDYIPNSKFSVLGYVHYTTIERSRRGHIQPGVFGGRKKFRPWELKIWPQRLAQAKPKEWTKDPYLLCILLGLAQLQDRERDPSKSYTHTSRLLVSSRSEKNFILLYEAKITTELLDGLMKLTGTTPPVKWPIISLKKIPYKPYDTFADRLHAEIAPSQVSAGDVNNAGENGGKRPCDQEDNEDNEDNELHRVKRISTR